MQSARTVSGWRATVIVLLAVWFGAVLFWGLRPTSDAVPTGIVNNQPTTQAVQCPAPLSGNSGPTEPLPPLPAGRAYERPACDSQHTQYRILFWTNTALVVVGIALLVGVRRRPQALASTGSPVTATVS